MDTAVGVDDTGDDATDICVLAAQRMGFLDALQVPGDGRVFFCHRIGDRSRWHFLETSVAACLAHEVNHLDNFPTTGCDS